MLDMAIMDHFQHLLSTITDAAESSPYSNDMIRSITDELIDLALLHTDYTKTFVINVHFGSVLFHKVSDKQLYITKLSQLSNKQLAPKGFRLEVENIHLLEDKRAKTPYRLSLEDESILERTQNLVSENGSDVRPYAFLMRTDGTIFDLRQPIINVGRDDVNAIAIEDPFISRGHCQIRLIKGNCWIFDKNSNSGTRVNGELISQRILHPGDVIRIGKTDLIFGIYEDEIADTSKM